MDASAWQLLLLELALVVVLAVLSAGEAAINIARRPGVIDELSLRGRRGQRASAIGRRAGYYLAAIQVAEFLIVFTYAGIAAAFIAPRLSALLAFFLRIDTTAIFTDVSAVAVTVAVLSLIAVLLGLFVPRAIAARHAQGTLLLLAFPLELITWLTRPVVTVLFPVCSCALLEPVLATPSLRLVCHEGESEELLAQVGALLRSRQHEEILRQIVEHAPVVIQVKDVHGRYLVVNRSWEALFGHRMGGWQYCYRREVRAFPVEPLQSTY